MESKLGLIENGLSLLDMISIMFNIWDSSVIAIKVSATVSVVTTIVFLLDSQSAKLLLVWLIFTIVKGLYFHPLSKFPGPRIAALSNVCFVMRPLCSGSILGIPTAETAPRYTIPGAT